MAKIQKQFEEFDKQIRLRRFSENATLRDKRDSVLRALEAGLDELREGGEEIPNFRAFDQGSYAVGTGVVPPGGDYDIDEGIEFELASKDHPDPVKVKEWVHRALEGHTDRVVVRRNCVTVYYHSDGEAIYHVDLAIYSSKDHNSDGRMHLAKGKLQSQPEHRVWEPSDPEGLVGALTSKWTGDDASQFRRVVRGLKRWKDERFPRDGNSAPRGISLTSAVFDEFQPIHRVVDPIANKVEPDDLTALRTTLDRVAGRFRSEIDPETYQPYPRLRTRLPALPYSDPFERMTPAQMRTFKEKLDELLEAVKDAENDPDPHTACKVLRKKFGDDFPVPDKEETAKPTRRATVSSGNSA
jgi:hypothetical protein